MSTEVEIRPFWVAAEMVRGEVSGVLERLTDERDDPMHVFAGAVIALREYMETGPIDRPATFQELLNSIDTCLSDMQRSI